jgi:hypothetical protein
LEGLAYDIVGCLIMPPSPLSLALAVQAKATRLAADGDAAC